MAVWIKNLRIMENSSIEIANTIINQIKVLDRLALMCYGAKNFIALPKSKQYQGGVQFYVSGLKHKGYVKIELRWVDDYSVTFINSKNQEVKSFQNVYCDMLVGVLDWIEGR